MCEFRGCMCTSFQHMRMHERQVFEGDFRCVLKLQSAFQCWVIFMANFVELRGKKWKIGEVQIKHEWMTVCMRGIWAGLCIFKNPLPAGLKDHRTSFVTRGCNYSAMGSGVQCLTQSGTTTGLFLCFQITIEVKPNHGNQSSSAEINLRQQEYCQWKETDLSPPGVTEFPQLLCPHRFSSLATTAPDFSANSWKARKGLC